MARNNDKDRQRTEDGPKLDVPPDEFEDMPGEQATQAGANGKRDALVAGPAVDPVCPLCRQPVYPGYGTAGDDGEFIHFDCVRHERGRDSELD